MLENWKSLMPEIHHLERYLVVLRRFSDSMIYILVILTRSTNTWKLGKPLDSLGMIPSAQLNFEGQQTDTSSDPFQCVHSLTIEEKICSRSQFHPPASFSFRGQLSLRLTTGALASHSSWTHLPELLSFFSPILDLRRYALVLVLQHPHNRSRSQRQKIVVVFGQPEEQSR